MAAQPLMIEQMTDMTVPEFSAPMTSGKTFRLADYAGKKLVLYFYPKDNTPGCIAESMRFRDLYDEYQKAGAEIVGASRDSLRSHEGFRAKFKLPFDLVSDQDETVCRLFGVMKSKMMYGKMVTGVDRCTFVIDGRGRIVKEWRGVKVSGHVDEVLEFVKSID